MDSIKKSTLLTANKILSSLDQDLMETEDYSSFLMLVNSMAKFAAENKSLTPFAEEAIKLGTKLRDQAITEGSVLSILKDDLLDNLSDVSKKASELEELRSNKEIDEDKKLEDFVEILISLVRLSDELENSELSKTKGLKDKSLALARDIKEFSEGILNKNEDKDFGKYLDSKIQELKSVGSKKTIEVEEENSRLQKSYSDLIDVVSTLKEVLG